MEPSSCGLSCPFFDPSIAVCDPIRFGHPACGCPCRVLLQTGWKVARLRHETSYSTWYSLIDFDLWWLVTRNVYWSKVMISCWGCRCCQTNWYRSATLAFTLALIQRYYTFVVAKTVCLNGPMGSQRIQLIRRTSLHNVPSVVAQQWVWALAIPGNVYVISWAHNEGHSLLHCLNLIWMLDYAYGVKQTWTWTWTCWPVGPLTRWPVGV